MRYKFGNNGKTGCGLAELFLGSGKLISSYVALNGQVLLQLHLVQPRLQSAALFFEPDYFIFARLHLRVQLLVLLESGLDFLKLLSSVLRGFYHLLSNNCQNFTKMTCEHQRQFNLPAVRR